MQALLTVKPSVIIVEEAAELLESQLLAVLQPSVQHLIMIGDHEQLRPQVENYELVSRKHFDVSMFERLVNNLLSASLARKAGCVASSLSSFVMCIRTFKATRVLMRTITPPSCLQHSMFFWTHHHHEKSERSCVNENEALMVIKLARWLVAEGWEPEKITVLARTRRR